ncbi:inosine/xanthosine triphosphate pyrophosphatase family protein [Skermanella aerolata]|uniref:HipA N-terminal subdomain 1 domain-containing protein n=1 Tax=Skermanella aerolata TaxID=393310 RepID=A0A512DP79_9PROT|nr:hypothetical protein [Skermanella aerolata]KJB95904.1 hypothetical protein N826_40055 [Skermanella aerolata KACC 11604]GEO38282.1 hypothetical protein SAE02_24300 [Skermanella aerolata]
MKSELAAFMAGRVVGTVTQDSRGSLTFTYDEGWPPNSVWRQKQWRAGWSSLPE